MTSRTNDGATVAGVEEEIAELERAIERMEGELQEREQPLSWDEVNENAAEELAAAEQRRGILPRLGRCVESFGCVVIRRFRSGDASAQG